MGSCWDLRDSHWSLCVTSLTSAYLLLTYGLRLIVCWFILSCCCGLSEFPISCLLVKDFFGTGLIQPLVDFLRFTALLEVTFLHSWVHPLMQSHINLYCLKTLQFTFLLMSLLQIWSTQIWFGTTITGEQLLKAALFQCNWNRHNILK